MTRRTRLRAFSAAAALVVAGVLCIALVEGVTGDVLGFVLGSLGLIAAISLVFLEVGLSEDRERGRDDEP